MKALTQQLEVRVSVEAEIARTKERLWGLLFVGLVVAFFLSIVPMIAVSVWIVRWAMGG